MATYAVLREGRDDDELLDLDRHLGFAAEEDEMPDHGSTFGGELIYGDFGQGGDILTVA